MFLLLQGGLRPGEVLEVEYDRRRVTVRHCTYDNQVMYWEPAKHVEKLRTDGFLDFATVHAADQGAVLGRQIVEGQQ